MAKDGYAVIKTGGKQYRVQEGDTISVEKLTGEQGDEIVFSDVLAVKGSADSELQIGNPLVEGAQVKAKIVVTAKGPKLKIFQKRRRKGSKKLRGFRATLTTVQVESISA